MNDYVTTEENRVFYKVYGINPLGIAVYVCENGYNPYEWSALCGLSRAALIEDLEWAQYEADHAPKNLKHITIERVKIHKIIQTKREVEVIKYEPKGLEPIIPF